MHAVEEVEDAMKYLAAAGKKKICIIVIIVIILLGVAKAIVGPLFRRQVEQRINS